MLDFILKPFALINLQDMNTKSGIVYCFYCCFLKNTMIEDEPVGPMQQNRKLHKTGEAPPTGFIIILALNLRLKGKVRFFILIRLFVIKICHTCSDGS